MYLAMYEMHGKREVLMKYVNDSGVQPHSGLLSKRVCSPCISCMVKDIQPLSGLDIPATNSNSVTDP